MRIISYLVGSFQRLVLLIKEYFRAFNLTFLKNNNKVITPFRLQKPTKTLIFQKKKSKKTLPCLWRFMADTSQLILIYKQ